MAPSGLELIEHPSGSGRFLRIRWRRDLHHRWLKAPILYLDAAGIGNLEIAKAWLPGIELAVEARANAAHMRVTQIVDSQISYRKIASGNTSEMLANIVETRGQSGLVVCPKSLRDKWERARNDYRIGCYGIIIRSEGATKGGEYGTSS